MKKLTHCPHCGLEISPRKQYLIKCKTCGKESKTYARAKEYCDDRCRANFPARLAKTLAKKRKARKVKYDNDPVFRAKSINDSKKRIMFLYSNDPVFRIRMNLRARLRKVLKKGPIRDFRQAGFRLKGIGCTRDELREHLAGQFYDGMTWGNYGSVWVVDHKKPLASFDLTKDDQIDAACHFSNIQPLLRQHNSEKSDKLDWVKP